jgi:FixJ family two-component response regulator
MPRHQYIAVVDDDESVRRSLGRLLQQAGFHPIGFASAEDFLGDALRVHFDCLLIDIRLKAMTGIELHQRLVSAGSRVPVIYLTAFDDPSARAEAKRAGCAGFFRKTDSAAEIVEAIKHAITPPAKPPSRDNPARDR